MPQIFQHLCENIEDDERTGSPSISVTDESIKDTMLTNYYVYYILYAYLLYAYYTVLTEHCKRKC